MFLFIFKLYNNLWPMNLFAFFGNRWVTNIAMSFSCTLFLLHLKQFELERKKNELYENKWKTNEQTREQELSKPAIQEILLAMRTFILFNYNIYRSSQARMHASIYVTPTQIQWVHSYFIILVFSHRIFSSSIFIFIVFILFIFVSLFVFARLFLFLHFASHSWIRCVYTEYWQSQFYFSSDILITTRKRIEQNEWIAIYRWFYLFAIYFSCWNVSESHHHSLLVYNSLPK